MSPRERTLGKLLFEGGGGRRRVTREEEGGVAFCREEEGGRSVACCRKEGGRVAFPEVVSFLLNFRVQKFPGRVGSVQKDISPSFLGSFGSPDPTTLRPGSLRSHRSHRSPILLTILIVMHLQDLKIAGSYDLDRDLDNIGFEFYKIESFL